MNKENTMLNSVNKKKKIIVTLGPSSYDPVILNKIEQRDVDFVRINISHTAYEEIEDTIKKVTSSVDIPLIVDTEGSQIRTGDLGREYVTLSPGTKIRIFNEAISCDNSTIYLRPADAIKYLRIGDLIFIDFDNAIVRVDDVSTLTTSGYLTCSVLCGGMVGNNKAVTVDDQRFSLPSFSHKDLKAIELAKKYDVKLINLSFVDSKEDVLLLRKLYPKATVISKIETRRGVNNLAEILDVSDAILIDRGDLSREIPFERIAFAQKIIIAEANRKNVPVFVATNLLDTMMRSLKPSRAEINDIINTLLDGADGLALAAETAIGKYPVQTIDFMSNLCRETHEVKASGLLQGLESDDLSKRIESVNYVTRPLIGSALIRPHGGTLVDRVLKDPIAENTLNGMRKLRVSTEVAMDAEQIAIGSFSPLDGFLNKKDFDSVLERMRLDNNIVWPIPIIFQVSPEDVEGIAEGNEVLLVESENGINVARLHVEDIYEIDKLDTVEKLFRTTELKHPGVARIMAGGDFVLGGKIDLINRVSNPNKHHELTPTQTRRIFEAMGWTRIVGFHTRNVIHRSHEYIQLRGLDVGKCDGLFVHPVIGKKKRGDYRTESIIETYERMTNGIYPTGKAVFGTFSTFSRYAGPREAVFTALCRQNFGCSHFIVGRDHTGVGEYYEPHDSQDIFDQFQEIDIKIIPFDRVVYCTSCNDYLQEGDCSHDSECKEHISGEKTREYFTSGISPPDWIMRPEISEIVLRRNRDGIGIFV